MPGKHTLKVTPQGDRDVVMTRDFDAPRAFVFDALTKPEHLRRWLLGPDGWELITCDIDLRVGGRFRYVWRKHGDASTDMGMSGVYRAVEPPARIVSTELFDQDWTGGEAVSTVVLTEKQGRTTLVNTVTYASREARDAVLKSGMESGVAVSYDRLDGIVAAMEAPA